MAGNGYETIYGVGLLDDIHNYFPALLYEQGRFQTLPNVFNYVRNQMNTRFNLYSYGSRRYTAGAGQATEWAGAGAAGGQATEWAGAGAAQAPAATVTLPAVSPGLAQLYRGYSQPQVTSLNAANLLLSFLDIGLEGEGTSGLRRPLTTNELLASLTPVIVRPSQEVLRVNTEIIQGSTVAQGILCTVCQDTIVNEDTCRRISACGHTYHQNCIDQWFSRNVHCPTCRYDIRDGPAPSHPVAPAPAPAPVAAPAADAHSMADAHSVAVAHSVANQEQPL